MKHLFWLVIAHYIGDYPYQGEFLAKLKGAYWYLLFCHCLIWTGCVAIALEHCGLWAWWKVVFLFLGHAAMDAWKARHPAGQTYGLTRLLWIDQAWHAIQCVAVWLL